MIEIKDPRTAPAAGVRPEAWALIARLFGQFVQTVEELAGDYQPATDGYAVLLEKGQARRELLALTHAESLEELVLESVQLFPQPEALFVAIWIPGDSFGLQLFVPDGPGLDPTLRRWLLAQAKPGESALLEDAS